MRCNQAEARPGRAPCVPATGKLRDLPLAQDAADTLRAGACPKCKGLTPENSSDE